MQSGTIATGHVTDRGVISGRALNVRVSLKGIQTCSLSLDSDGDQMTNTNTHLQLYKCSPARACVDALFIPRTQMGGAVRFGVLSSGPRNLVIASWAAMGHDWNSCRVHRGRSTAGIAGVRNTKRLLHNRHRIHSVSIAITH